MKQLSLESEAERLEKLWGGDFGEAYVERNLNAGKGREAFWEMILRKYCITRVLEIGCNIGANLKLISKRIEPREIYGVDISDHALQRLRASAPALNAVWSAARYVPFRDKWFDLVFTAGVLIHQPETTLPVVMSEVVRCSRRFVLCLEYFAETTVEISYRGQQGALFKRNYGKIYKEMFPELRLLESGELTPDQGWDNVTYWLFCAPGFELQ